MKTIYTFILCCMTSFGYSQIDAAEYFIDDHEAAGSGTPITINTPGNSISETFSIDTSLLSNGIHTLYVRTRDASGEWSIYYKHTFLVHDFTDLTTPTDIVAAEYFIDDHEAPASGTPITINTSGFDITESFAIDTTPLSNGIHTLYVRTKDVDNRWSLFYKHTFLVHDFTDLTMPSQIIAAEYFIDTHVAPGASGNEYAIGPSFSVSEPLAISTAALSDGIHTLYVRTKDADDRWSLYYKQTFLVHSFSSPVQTGIDQYEYFFDTKVATGGSGNIVDVDPTTFNLNETSIPIPSGSLAEGTHYLHIRTRDEDGNWSLYEVIEFEVTETLGIEDNLLLLTKIYPVPASTQITIDAKTNIIESITLFDITGKEINSFSVDSQISKIDVSNYAKGIYILKVKSDKGVLNKKIIIN